MVSELVLLFSEGFGLLLLTCSILGALLWLAGIGPRKASTDFPVVGGHHVYQTLLGQGSQVPRVENVVAQGYSMVSTRPPTVGSHSYFCCS